MFRIEWWVGKAQNVRTSQTADNVRELLDMIPLRNHVRIIDEIGGILCDRDMFAVERGLA